MKFQSGKEHINFKHGLYKNRLYGIWSNMKTRCCSETYHLYKDYGARGIEVCDEWLNDFEHFYNWAISNGYQDNLTIDRINNNGNYEPSNCRWVDMKTQNRNRRSNVWLECRGQKKILNDWAKDLNVDRRTISRRLKLGWSVENALFTPVNGKKVV